MAILLVAEKRQADERLMGAETSTLYLGRQTDQTVLCLDELWIQHSRMSEATLEKLHTMIGPPVGPVIVPPDRRIATVMYKLATCME